MLSNGAGQKSAVLEDNYPKLKNLAESGKIGVIADPYVDEHEYVTLGKWNYERRVWHYDKNLGRQVDEIVTDKEATPIEWQILGYSDDGKKAYS